MSVHACVINCGSGWRKNVVKRRGGGWGEG